MEGVKQSTIQEPLLRKLEFTVKVDERRLLGKARVEAAVGYVCNFIFPSLSLLLPSVVPFRVLSETKG